MDKDIVLPAARDVIVTVLTLAAVLAAFVLAGTIDHPQEVAHEGWVARLEREGACVIR